MSFLPPLTVTERSRPEITPELNEPAKPSGCPTAYVSSPTWPPPPSTAGTIVSGACSGWSTAMSFFGSVEAIVAEALVPSTKETRMLVAPVDDVQARS